MRLISWNTNGRYGRALPLQIDAVASREPDLVALQEVRRESVAAWRMGLEAIGLPCVIDTNHLLDRPSRGGHDYRRRYFNLVAARWPLAPEHGLDIAFPERYLGASLAIPSGEVEIHNVHLPPGSTRGLIKIEMFEALYTRLAVHADRPRILCGDFNTPAEEHADGMVVFWGREHPQHRERWDAAERSVLLGLSAYDLADVFRREHGCAAPDASFVLCRHGKRFARRYDHVMASALLHASRSRYHHRWRDPQRLSDHSAIEVTFDSAAISQAD